MQQKIHSFIWYSQIHWMSRLKKKKHLLTITVTWSEQLSKCMEENNRLNWTLHLIKILINPTIFKVIKFTIGASCSTSHGFPGIFIQALKGDHNAETTPLSMNKWVNITGSELKWQTVHASTVFVKTPDMHQNTAARTAHVTPIHYLLRTTVRWKNFIEII